MNNIYNTCNILEDFLQTVFITVPKVPQAQEHADFQTIRLISHTSKIMLHMINSRTTSIIEQDLWNSQRDLEKKEEPKMPYFNSGL